VFTNTDNLMPISACL